MTIKIVKYIFIGALIGTLYAAFEYLIKLETDSEELLFPLLLRGLSVGSIIFGFTAIIEDLLKEKFRNKKFFYLIIVKSIVYTLVISFSLFIVNGLWFSIFPYDSFINLLINYFFSQNYLVNIITIYPILLILISIDQINSLHRKGELWNFITGKYHNPREVNRIFCFIDLKGSTTIAEKLGNIRFANFIKDYYSDISAAIIKTDAQIYQYVGDEIVLSWSYRQGLKNNNMLQCFFLMKKLIDRKKDIYLSKYGYFPEFRAGMHGGPVIVTWIGEVKKEIVYIGDVLNTGSRIQENCKRLKKDFLISKKLLNLLKSTTEISFSFVEKIIPRGKHEPVELYSLELISKS